MMKVMLRHGRALGYCTKGIRLFGKKHNLNYLKFIKEGIEAEELEKLNDSMANKMIEVARKENGS